MLIQQHHIIMQKDEEYHKQRAKKQWVTMGDRNTSFFQKCILKRARKNRIPFIITHDGHTLTTNEQMADYFKTYFTNLFTSQLNDMNVQELSVFDTGNAPQGNLDNGQKHEERCSTRTRWPQRGILQGSMAVDCTRCCRTHHQFLPNRGDASGAQQNIYIANSKRPISLCNVIYKIIYSTIAKRIKKHLPSYIDKSQATFIPGRHISTNIILAQEITHSFSLKNWNQRAFMLKIDLTKAFDRIEWSFISRALFRRGFSPHFCNLVHQRISTTSFSVMINGQPYRDFSAQRGIRQDDLIVCGQTTQEEITSINNILQSFCRASGQTPNWGKSSITFSRKVTEHQRNMVLHVFQAPLKQSDTIHLGHPLLLTYRNRNAAYNFLINKFRTKLTGLKADTLSHAGCLVYINSVLTSIPIYYMTNIMLPKDLLEKITAITRNFWWKGQQNEGTTKSICFRAWEDICQPKHLGGLGIKNITTVNRSLVTHSAWMVAAQKDPFLSKVLKSKYHPHTSFWNAPLTGSRSVFWSSVQAVKHYIQDNSFYQIHEGIRRNDSRSFEPFEQSLEGCKSSTKTENFPLETAKQ
ncbi:hypothetical protein U9M48_009094 [Paspalum notatum var. saurae]|uniref:Reverse transcriptase domain-containing protein n=1 Tax=Paspalum notatum var. saurae TaxID=547442 RepID=A0AAQ3WEI1_PASNO